MSFEAAATAWGRPINQFKNNMKSRDDVHPGLHIDFLPEFHFNWSVLEQRNFHKIENLESGILKISDSYDDDFGELFSSSWQFIHVHNDPNSLLQKAMFSEQTTRCSQNKRLNPPSSHHWEARPWRVIARNRNDDNSDSSVGCGNQNWETTTKKTTLRINKTTSKNSFENCAGKPGLCRLRDAAQFCLLGFG